MSNGMIIDKMSLALTSRHRAL